MNQEPDPLDLAVEGVADETPVDWEALRRRFPELSDRLQRLQALQALASAHRAAAGGRSPPPVEPAPLFEWGSLRVLERLGSGGFGEVYRAWDPALQRDVALKLRPEGADQASARAWLDEARRMARVRHPNVLVVHGADVRDGRAGIWTDLVHGRTLEEQLAAQGPWSAREAALVGLELCRALAAVHAIGLVHGDVKASNVMREGSAAARGTADSGRIVLMDFGAATEQSPAALAGATAGTPLTTAPEVLEAGSATPASDIYSLGVLLHRLVSGRYPFEATSLEELRGKISRDARTTLVDLRPALPSAFVTVIERAVARDPADRFPSAGAMERSLADFLAPAAARATRSYRRTAAWAGMAAALAIVAILALPRTGSQRDERETAVPRPAGGETQLPSQPDPSTPLVQERSAVAPKPVPSTGASDDALEPLAVEATFFRWRAGSRSAIGNGDRVQPGDLLTLEIRTAEPVHAYVLNEDERGSVSVLFPLAGMRPQNPLGAGTVHRLPGDRDGTALDWQVTSAGDKELFLVVASRSALPALERRIGALPHASTEAARNGAAPAAGAARKRGVSGLAVHPQVEARSSSSRLRALADQLHQEVGDPGGVWMRWLQLLN